MFKTFKEKFSYFKENPRELLINVGLQNITLTLMTKGLGFIVGLYAVRVFSNTQYGLFTYIMLISSYIPLAQLGLFQGLILEYPTQRIQNKNESIHFFNDINFLSVILHTLAGISLFFFDFGVSTRTIIFFYLSLILDRFIENKYVHLTTHMEFYKLNLLRFLRETFIPLLRLFILFNYQNFEYFILAPLVLNILVLPFTIFIHHKTTFFPTPEFIRHIRLAYKVGFPAYLLAAMDSFFLSLDRLFISKFYEIEQLAVYGFFTTITLAVNLLITSYMAPKVQILWNLIAQNNHSEASDYFKAAKKRVYLLLIPLVIMLIIFFPIMTKYIIKKFHDDWALYLSLISISFLFCSNIINIDYMLGKNQTKHLLRFQGEILVLNLILNSIVSYLKIDIIYFSFATIISLFLYYIRCQNWIKKDKLLRYENLS
ncbi:MAG: hypothetical protein H6622_12780 [Halobacteriovoraceae bacterium]|nr:hypothetical protein [Halobacteriovoraceae bacterium]